MLVRATFGARTVLSIDDVQKVDRFTPMWEFVLLGVLALLVFFTYVMICGTNKFHRNGCVGSVHRFFTRRIPAFFERLAPKGGDIDSDDGCCGPAGRCKNAVICFYAFIYINFIIVYFRHVFPFIPHLFPNSTRYHSVMAFLVLPWPWIIVIALHYLDPGYITAENVESYLEIYPYDNVLFSRSFCPTLNIPVPPRSRFCRFRNKRVSRYDHFCPWVMAPIGERTHRYFLAFLALNAMASSYYFVNLLRWFLWVIVQLSPRIPWTNNSFINFAMVSYITVRRTPYAVIMSIVLAVVAITLWFFLAQQAYFVSKNLTQIELEKIDDLKEKWKKDGVTKKYVHAYSKGFVGNWKALLFPPVVKTHAPRDYSKEIAQRERAAKEDQRKVKAN
jgi:hypothetical protein